MKNESASLSECLKKLEEWFKKDLTGSQFQMFLEKIKTIPPEAMNWIVDRYIDNNPPTPGRFPTPANIRELWFIWMKENPNKVAPPPRTDCDSCQGTGFHWKWRMDEETQAEYNFVYRCPSCSNWQRDCGLNSKIPFYRKVA